MKTIICGPRVFIFTVAFATTLLSAEPTPDLKATAAQEKAACTKNMQQIYEAIQAYRKEHKDLPKWLSDLVPNHLADSTTLICPVTKRTGQGIAFKNLADPKIETSYLYEFSDAETGGIWGGGKLKMRDFKMMQMGFVGGGTPILRCWLHDPVLNIGFDGKAFESPINWESLFSDVVNFDDLGPDKLVQRFVPAREALAANEAAPKPQPQAAREDSKTPKTGEPAPEITGEDLEGVKFKLSEYRGKVVMLDFWGDW